MSEREFKAAAWTEHGGYQERKRLRRIEPRKYELFPELAEWFIFDHHLHVVPPGDVEAAIREGRSLVSIGWGQVKIGGYMVHDRNPPSFGAGASAELALQDMNRVGIDMANLTQADAHGHFNDYVSDCLQKWPDRFIGTAVVDMDFDDLTMIQLEEAHGKGLRVLNFIFPTISPWEDPRTVRYSINPTRPDFRLAAPYMEAFWDKLSEWQWAVTLDIPRRGPHRVIEQIFRDIESIVQQYPSIRFIQEHFCYPSFPYCEERMSLLRYPNVYTEMGCASHGIFVMEDSTQPSAQAHLKRMLDEFDGEDSIMFGSDYPYILNHATYWQVVDWIFRQCEFLTDVQRQKIFGLNAIKCHHLEEKVAGIQARKKRLREEMGDYYDPYF